uniref:Uncharacterized protein n=1 Tax=Anguilla anguilla TaxID=7936 RepID=A0A0E9PRJ9_ANGAN
MFWKVERPKKKIYKQKTSRMVRSACFYRIFLCIQHISNNN